MMVEQQQQRDDAPPRDHARPSSGDTASSRSPRWPFWGALSPACSGPGTFIGQSRREGQLRFLKRLSLKLMPIPENESLRDAKSRETARVLHRLWLDRPLELIAALCYFGLVLNLSLSLAR